MNLKQQHEAALKAAREIAERVKAESRDFTDEELKTIEGHMAKADDLAAQIERAEKGADIVRRLDSFKGTTPTDNDDQPARTLGEHFIKHGGKRLMETKGVSGATVSVPEFVKANTDTQSTPSGGGAGIYGIEWDKTIVPAYRRPLVVADLLSSGTLSGTGIAYMVEGALEGDFETVAEGGAKPQIHFAEPELRSEGLKKIAAFIKFTDEMIEDFDFIVSNINNRGLYQLGLTEENQLLTGDGNGNNLLGLLNRTGIQTMASTGVSDNADALFRAMTNVQTATGFSADGIVINPADYQALRLSRDANGQYYGGGFFQGEYGNGSVMANPPIWGATTVVTAAVPQGTAVVGALKQAATVYRKGGVRVETTNSHAEDFTNNLVTTRIEERVGLECRFPAAVVNVTLAA